MRKRINTPASNFSDAIGAAARKLLKLVVVDGFDIFIPWLMMTTVNIAFHHLIPLDETRYAAVAWEMWYGHDFLVPHLNGAPYHHKPPLLFWLYDVGWSLFGVSELWLLLVAPLCGLVSLYLTRYMAALLWPGDRRAMRLAPWLLFGSLLWGAFLNSAMFDTLLTACVLLALSGLVKAGRDLHGQSWILFALGCGLGLLAKGPVVFVSTLPPFLMGAVWSDAAKSRPTRWYLYGLAALAGAIGLALLWAVPAILSAGNDYGATLLWHQTVDRISNSFAHKRPIWWYLALSPVLLFPWFFWPRVWRSLGRHELLQEASFRFCLLWFGSGFIAFSLISGKQAHYLIPLMPAMALLLTRVLPKEATAVKPGDYLPFLVIGVFALLLLILPQLQELKLYHWLRQRDLWWAVTLLLVAFCPMMTMAYTRSISPYLLPVTMILALISSLMGFFSSTGNAFHLRQATQLLEKYREAGDSLAWAGKYDGQLQFLLRMTQPMAVIDKSAVDDWLASHSNGHVVSVERQDKNAHCNDYWQYYREDKLCIRSQI
ncbi:ArnT family glycosyltransferase [Methylomarinum vadi]|uniref:ArnT family glycosyltransferase n=1 Tax=Methylomarinum vadi TaxID=438855 RepID=UPI001F2036F4|nr:glycosyltransferase family 39 protein [Methylomarinum vadi]